MKNDLVYVLPILVAVVAFLLGYATASYPTDTEAVCTQKGGHLVRTYSTTVCAKLEVIK